AFLRQRCLPRGFAKADEAERGFAGRVAGAEQEGPLDQVSVRREAREEVGLGKRADHVAEFLRAVIAAGGVAETLTFAAEVAEHGAQLGDGGRRVADRALLEDDALRGEPLGGFAAGVAVLVGVDDERGGGHGGRFGGDAERSGARWGYPRRFFSAWR